MPEEFKEQPQEQEEQKPEASQERKEPNPEQMTEALDWTKDAVEAIPAEAFVSPKEFAIALYEAAYKFFQEADQRYGNLKKYTIPASEQVQKIVEIYIKKGSKNKDKTEITHQSYNLNEDCKYGFIRLALKKYISMNCKGPFFEILVGAMDNLEARNFLQQEQFKEIPYRKIMEYDYIDSSKFDGFSEEEYKALSENYDLQKEDIERILGEIPEIYHFPASSEGIEILKKAGLGGLKERSDVRLDHIIGTVGSSFVNSLASINSPYGKASKDYWKFYPGE